jgi:hypothetical protein
MPSSNGVTRFLAVAPWTDLAMAPASKWIHGDVKCSRSTHRIPNRDSSNSRAISSLQRVPLPISSDVQGSTLWITFGSQSISNPASFFACSPDQLRKTFMTRR